MTWRLQRYVRTPRVRNDVIFFTLDIIVSLFGGGGGRRREGEGEGGGGRGREEEGGGGRRREGEGKGGGGRGREEEGGGGREREGLILSCALGIRHLSL